MYDTSLQKGAAALLEQCKEKGLTLATAESCTGGLLAALLTEISGSSSVFMGGVVSYSNALKQELLDVSFAALEEHGAVSPEVAMQMAKGAQKMSQADIAISITGIAGPGGGTDEKPVGLVYIGYVIGQSVEVERHVFAGNRSEVRKQTVVRCLQLLTEIVSRP